MDVVIKYEIIDLINQEDKESFSDILTCQICFESYLNKQIFQCKEGHNACFQCWERIVSSRKKACFICRKKIEFDQLSRNRSMESMIANKKINCPYSFSNIYINNNIEENIIDNSLSHNSIESNSNNNTSTRKLIINSSGCKEMIKIEQLEQHLLNCKYKIVECSNRCGYTGRLIEYNSKHQDECNYGLIECNECKERIKRIEKSNHLKLECPLITIQCPQCKNSLKRNQLDSHIEKECPNTNIKCKYSKSCKDEFKRCELSTHLKQVSHLDAMKIIIDENEKEIEIYKQQLKEANDRCNSLIKNLGNTLERVYKSLDNVYSNRWEINQFNSKIKQFTVFDSIFSSKFRIGSYQFYLGLSLTGENGFNNIDTDYLSIYVYVIDLDTPIGIKCEFEIINNSNYSRNKKILLNGQFDKPADQDIYIEQVLSKLSYFSKTSGYISNDNNETLFINFTIYLTNTIIPLKN